MGAKAAKGLFVRRKYNNAQRRVVSAQGDRNVEEDVFNPGLPAPARPARLHPSLPPSLHAEGRSSSRQHPSRLLLRPGFVERHLVHPAGQIGDRADGGAVDDRIEAIKGSEK
jgi:hypothetical protein